MHPVTTEGQSLILTGNEVLMQDELSFPQDSTRVQINPKTKLNKKNKQAGQQFSPSTIDVPANVGNEKKSPSQQTKPEKPVPVYPPTISVRTFLLLSYLIGWFVLTLWRLLV
jgi:hypothetical protein